MATQAATTHFLQFRIQYSSIALIFYDYALTFPTEVKYVWGSKFRLSTALYICCRYALLANVLYLLAIAKKLGASCDTWYKIIGALSVFGRAAVIVTFTGRTYAICARNRIILIYLVAIGLACIILDIMHLPGLRCVGSSTNPLANLLLSILMVVFEYSSAILITIRSIQAFKFGGSWKTQRRGFIYLIFEQGIFYFSVVSLITTAAVILNSVAPAGFFQRLLNALLLPLSGLLTARFLLRLRVWEHQHSAAVVSDGRGIASQHTRTRTMEFRVLSVVDEFGEDPVGRQLEGEYALEGETSQENMPSTSSLAPGGLKMPTVTA